MVKKNKKEFQKKWENFWYYYKFHVIAGILVLALIGVFVKDKLTQIDYDYNVAIVTEEGVPQEEMDALQQLLEREGADRNGDKKVHVLLQNYAIGGTDNQSGNPQITMANQQKFLVDIQTGTSMIMIYSHGIYQKYEAENVFQVENGTLKKMSDCAGYSQLGSAPYLGNLNISMRTYDDSLIEGEKGMKSYYEDSRKLLERFEHGSK